MAGVDEFLRNLQKSNLLTEEQWKLVRRETAGISVGAAPGSDTTLDAVASGPSTPAALARTLVERGFLTSWQAEKLLQGHKTFYIGKYRLLDGIGSGGMGAVFKALQGDLGRVVAIKLMSREVMRDRHAIARFRKEVRAVAALDDPHIVAAYDASSTAGLHYLVMEYVEGHDLGWLVNENGPLPVAFSCECIRQAALGLQYAHEQGLVHRDIKPTNLLVARDPESDRPLVKILDLGLARFVSETVSEAPGSAKGSSDGSLTQLGQFLGTPDYIAPEQALDIRAADIRSDIFSLGCTFFRMLTGELPFEGETVLQKIEARETTDARRVRTLRAEVPAELDAVIARMLARDPKDRYQTPREVARALAPFTGAVAALPVRRARVPGGRSSERPPEEDPRLEEFFRALAAADAERSLSVVGIARHLKEVSPKIWIPVAGLVLAFVAGVGLWDWTSTAAVIIDWPLSEREGAELRVNRRQIRIPAAETFPINGRPGQWEMSLAREGYETIEKRAMLRRGERLPMDLEWRPTPETAQRLRLEKFKGRIDAAKTEPFSAAAVALRAEILSFLREHPMTGEARAARKLAALLRWPLDHLDGSGVTDDNWQPPPATADGAPPPRPVAVFGDGRLKFWNTISAVATSRDGTLIAGASLDGTVQVFDVVDGRRRCTIIPPTPAVELVFHTQKPTLAVAGPAGPVTLWNATTGERLATLAETAAPVAFSPDGTLVATRAARQEIALWDAASGELRRTMQGHATGILQGLVFSLGGKMLASYGSDSSVLLWDVASGQERRRFPNAQIPLFSPDDGFLAAGATNGDLILWDTRTGETQRTLDDGGHPLAFNAAGNVLLSRRQGRAIVWNLATGDEMRTIVDVPELALVSPDGNWLAGGDESFGEVRLWNLSQGGAPRAVATLGPIAALAFTPDSSTVVSGTRNHVLQMFAASTGVERTPAGLPLGPADLSPDGELLVMRRGTQVELVEAATGAARRTFAGNVPDLELLLFSPDGGLVAGYGGWGFFRTSLRLWDPSNGRELSLAGEPLGSVRTMAFSLDARLLACAGDSRLVTVWDVTKQSVRQTLDEFSDRVTAVAFHPDGQNLAVACNDQTIVLWDLKAKQGKTLAKQGGIVRQLEFNSDGNLLAGAADGRVLVWNIERGKSPADLAAGDGPPTSIAFDPSGTMLVAAGTEGVLWLWSEPDRDRYRIEPDRVVPVGPPHGVIQRVLWSPDGRHLVTVNGNGTVYVLPAGGK
jgi:WD40 repeat protein/serine/threonine protein kinase